MVNSDGKEPPKEVRDNAKKDYKPEHAGRDNHAPVGSVGLTPGKTGVQFSNQEMTGVSKDAQRQVEKESQKDNRPAFKQTGDHEVDRFYSKENKMISKDDDRQR